LADTKISGLTAASTLDSTELYAADQGGNSRKVTGAQIQTMVLRGGTATAGSWPIIGNGTLLTSAAALPASASLTTATQQFTLIRAIAECATAGNIRLSVTCSAGTVTPRRGCYYTARRVFAGNVGTFAA
jgi:hypothetical protein